MKARFFVGNVAYNLNEEALVAGFAQLGITAENVKIAREKETQRPRGFAFVEVEEAVVPALMKLGAEGAAIIGGRSLRIERAERQPDSDRPSGGPKRSFGAGGGGDRRDKRGGGGGAPDQRDEAPWREDRRRQSRR